jgi:hypothetical protein
MSLSNSEVYVYLLSSEAIAVRVYIVELFAVAHIFSVSWLMSGFMFQTWRDVLSHFRLLLAYHGPKIDYEYVMVTRTYD